MDLFHGDPIPPSGFDGTYDGSCVACLRGTDTGLAFKGDAEWLLAGLRVLGVEDEVASVMVSDFYGAPSGEVGDWEVTMPLRVCSECATKRAQFPTGLIATGLPVITPAS